MSPGSERLSSADASWLHMERPTNLMVINSLLMFEQPLDFSRLSEIVGSRLVDRYPRFHQLVVEGGALRGPLWRDDQAFQLERHMHRLGLPSPGDLGALRELVGDLMTMPIDRSKPLWDIYAIDGHHDGCVLLVRMHHCIADGIALANVMLSLADPSPRARPVSRVGETKAQVRSGASSTISSGVSSAVCGPTSAVRSVAGASTALLRQGGAALRHPRQFADLSQELAGDSKALAELVFASPDVSTSLKGNPSAGRRVAWSQALSLQTIKDVAHRHSATVNDVLLSALSGALRRHLLDRGEQPLQMRALVPFNLRASQEPVSPDLGNRFGLVLLSLPLDIGDRRRRLAMVRRRMDHIKSSRQGPVSYMVLGAGGLAPTRLESVLVDFFTSKATAVVTDVPGPREPVYLAGARLGTVLVWAPASGSVGISVSLFSYCAEVTVGLMVAPNLVAMPQRIVDQVEREIVSLGKLGPVAGSDGPTH